MPFKSAMRQIPRFVWVIVVAPIILLRAVFAWVATHPEGSYRPVILMIVDAVDDSKCKTGKWPERPEHIEPNFAMPGEVEGVRRALNI